MTTPFIHGLTSALGLARDNAPSRTPTPEGYGWQMLGGNRITQHDTYDNVFPYVNAIAQRFSTLIPYAVDADGNRIEPTPMAVAALYNPNDSYSCLEFLKYIATGILTQSHLDVLVWTRDGNMITPGGRITTDNIAGYTFLPQSSRQYNTSRSDWYHRVTMSINGVEDSYEFTRWETIALNYSVHPVDPTRGISPAMTIQKWANVDDMIADYERGFFGNGAVPAGMMGIVSENADDFMRNKNRLEDTFRGAGNNNGVVYNMIPVDPLTRKPAQTGKLIWVPFQQSNNTLDLSTVNDVVNNRLASALAVPDIVRGIDSGQTYANAQMAERAFIENTLQPLALTIWDKWQFELDRITGGLGYGISFDLDLPAQTDVEQVQATTQQTQVNSLIALVNAGASVSAAVEALGLPDEYKRLTLLPQSTTPAPTPSTPQLTSARPDYTEREPFETTDDTEETAYKKGVRAARKFFRAVADRAQRLHNDATNEWDDITLALVNEMFEAYRPVIIAYAQQNGLTIVQAIEELATIDDNAAQLLEAVTAATIAQSTAWTEVPDKYAKAYKDRLKVIAARAADTANHDILRILAQADEEKWSAGELRRALRHYVDNNRAELLARNETVNAERLGSYYSAQAVSEAFGVNIEYIWNCSHDEKTCDFCNYMDGKSVPLGESFMNVGDSITVNGKTYVNNFMDKITPDGHPNCRCYATERVVGVRDDWEPNK